MLGRAICRTQLIGFVDTFIYATSPVLLSLAVVGRYQIERRCLAPEAASCGILQIVERPAGYLLRGLKCVIILYLRVL